MGLIKKGHLIEAGVLYLAEQVPQAGLATEAVSEPTPEPLPETPPELELLEKIGSREENLQGDELVDYAKNEAEQILKKAMQEAEAIKEHAKESGLEDAHRAAEESASEKVKEALEILNQAAIERKKIIKDAESEILRLALKVAEQIVKSEVSLHRDVSLNIVSDAISRVSDREQVIIRVNRDDVENIKKYKDRISSVVDGIKSLSIIEDAAVEQGGCVIETNLGYVDARISTKIAAIEEAFRKVK